MLFGRLVKTLARQLRRARRWERETLNDAIYLRTRAEEEKARAKDLALMSPRSAGTPSATSPTSRQFRRTLEDFAASTPTPRRSPPQQRSPPPQEQQRSPIIELTDIHPVGPVEQVLDAIEKIEKRKGSGRPYNYVGQADTLFRATQKMAEWEEQNAAIARDNPGAGELLDALRQRLSALTGVDDAC